MTKRTMTKRSTGRWFETQRMAWIGEMLRIYGFINRCHLMRKFGISTPQASTDLKRFQRLNPGVTMYDAKLKRYIAKKDPAP